MTGIKQTGIKQKVERSSFGTRDGRAARKTISTATAAKVVARASTPKISPRRVGG